MKNPFEIIDARLGIIENLLLDLRHNPLESKENSEKEKWFDLDGLCNYLPQKPAKKTLYGKLSLGKIPGHKRGKKWFFLKEEIDDWLKEGKVKTVSEIEVEVEAYLSNKNKGLK